MSRRSLAHLDADEVSRRLTTLEILRARLFDVDVDRKRRIDDAIDYFGARHLGTARDPCGESLLDGPGAS
jgi:hypothetical protein